jgi:hypothetical protein
MAKNEGPSKILTNWVWWYIPVIPACRIMRQEDHELEVSLDYITSPCLKRNKNYLQF